MVDEINFAQSSTERLRQAAAIVSAVRVFCHFVDEIEINPGVDMPKHMIIGYHTLQIDRIEQYTLRILLTLHSLHPSWSYRILL